MLCICGADFMDIYIYIYISYCGYHNPKVKAYGQAGRRVHKKRGSVFVAVEAKALTVVW